ncbi:MAG: hypothetical protein GY861_20995 [bacterium]|nr:hypothetical protein [bacterium]
MEQYIVVPKSQLLSAVVKSNTDGIDYNGLCVEIRGSLDAVKHISHKVHEVYCHELVIEPPTCYLHLRSTEDMQENDIAALDILSGAVTVSTYDLRYDGCVTCHIYPVDDYNRWLIGHTGEPQPECLELLFEKYVNWKKARSKTWAERRATGSVYYDLALSSYCNLTWKQLHGVPKGECSVTKECYEYGIPEIEWNTLPRVILDFVNDGH